MDFSDVEVQRITKLYQKAEVELLKEFNTALLKGNQTEYLDSMLKNARAILRDLEKGSRTWCREAIPRVYMGGIKTADGQISDKKGPSFGDIHQRSVKILADATYSRFEDSINTIGRRANDIYRAIALENTRKSIVGYKSWQAVAKEIKDDLAENGVTGFKDRTGRKWNMKSYTEMVARTTTMEAHLEGTKNRFLERGRDLVIVSSHSNPCDLCKPWQGKVLSLSGNTPGYPTLKEAKSKGLFHPRCGHTFSLYLDMEKELVKSK